MTTDSEGTLLLKKIHQTPFKALIKLQSCLGKLKILKKIGLKNVLNICVGRWFLLVPQKSWRTKKKRSCTSFVSLQWSTQRMHGAYWHKLIHTIKAHKVRLFYLFGSVNSFDVLAPQTSHGTTKNCNYGR